MLPTSVAASTTPHGLAGRPGENLLLVLAGGHWPGAPVGGWAVPSAEPPQQQLVQKSSGGPPASQDYFGNALHRDSGSPHVRPRGSEQEVSLRSRVSILVPRTSCGNLYDPAYTEGMHVKAGVTSVLCSLWSPTTVCQPGKQTDRRYQMRRRSRPTPTSR